QLPEGAAAFDRPLIEVERGEHVLISGCSDSGRSELLRAVAGLWPSGSGTILLPPPNQVMFMPPRPYLPFTTLRAAVTYPEQADGFEEDAVCAALKRVGLERLIAKLDEKERWDKLLPADEQQRLALARLLVHAPLWVFFEDTALGMNEDHCRLMRSIVATELAGTTVTGIGRHPPPRGRPPALGGFYPGTLRLRPLQPIPHPRARTSSHRHLQPVPAAEVGLRAIRSHS